jgi:hypothetical protein
MSFQRFARKEGIADDAVCEAVNRAERGLIDADLGGGVIKQRVPRPGEGRSGGFRSIILYRTTEWAFFVYGYPKSERENIAEAALEGFRNLAKDVFTYSADDLQKLFKEVICQ